MMNHRYPKLLIAFFAFTALVWIPWGLYCLFVPEAWSGQVIPGMEVYDVSQVAARVEVRAMYGGLQFAIGIFALIAALKPEHRASALLFFTLLMSGLALSRMAGILIDGSGSPFVFSWQVTPQTYNQVGLTSYEFPFMLWSWFLFVTRK